MQGADIEKPAEAGFSGGQNNVETTVCRLHGLDLYHSKTSRFLHGRLIGY